jgi:hypothetical protein
MTDSRAGNTPITQAVTDLGRRIFDLATETWQRLKDHDAVSQELLKDPFSQQAKEHTATAELLLLLHISDRVAATIFHKALPAEHVQTIRTTFISAVVGVAIPAFIQLACAEQDTAEQAETQADLVHLYNTRAVQYGLFELNGQEVAESGALLKLGAIRIAEAIECPDSEAVLHHATDATVLSLQALTHDVPLQQTIARLLAEAR